MPAPKINGNWDSIRKTILFFITIILMFGGIFTAVRRNDLLNIAAADSSLKKSINDKANDLRREQGLQFEAVDQRLEDQQNLLLRLNDKMDQLLMENH